MRWLGGPFPGAGARSPQPAPRVGPPLQAGHPRAVPAPPPPHPAGRVRPAPAAPGPEPRSALPMHKIFGGLQGVFEILAEAASPPGSHTAPTVELGDALSAAPDSSFCPRGRSPPEALYTRVAWTGSLGFTQSRKHRQVENCMSFSSLFIMFSSRVVKVREVSGSPHPSHPRPAVAGRGWVRPRRQVPELRR